MNISKKEFEGFLITLPTVQKVAEALGVELLELESWVSFNYQKPLAKIQKQFKAQAQANINQQTILSASKSSSMSKQAQNTITQTDNQTDGTNQEKLKNIFEMVMSKLKCDPRFVALKPTAQKITAYFLEFKNNNTVSQKSGINIKTVENYVQYTNKVREGLAVQDLIAEYSALEATLCHDEKEALIMDLKNIKQDSMNNREYRTAIDSIKQISVMRGFNAPQEMSVKGVQLGDILKELKNKPKPK